MKPYLLFVLSLLLLCCSVSKQEVSLEKELLLGKWYVSEKGDNYIIEISKDSTMRMFSYDFPGERKSKIIALSKDKMELVDFADPSIAAKSQASESGYQVLKEENQGPTVQLINYELNGDTLMLYDVKRESTTLATSCRTGICNAQKEFFRQVAVSIDLPYVDKNNEPYETSEDDVTFYIGQPNELNLPAYGKASRIWSSKGFLHIIDIPYTIQKAKENNNGELRVACFIDAGTGMAHVLSLMNQVQQMGIEEIDFIVRKNQDVSQHLDLGYIRKSTQSLDAINGDQVFKTWIEEK